MSFTKISDTLNVHQSRARRPTEDYTELQQLYDQDVNTVKTRFNEFIDELEAITAAADIGCDPTNVTASNVDDALSEIQANLATYVLGEIPDNTLTNAKLASDIKIGSLALLDTTIKTSIVNAINEIVSTTIPNLNAVLFYGKYSQMSGGDELTADGVVTFDTEDNDDFTAIDISGAPTKLTIGSGITTVKFYAYLSANFYSNATTTITVRKNGTTTVATLLKGSTDIATGDDITLDGVFYSLPVSVSENDYFELYFDEDTTGTLYAGSVFGMEVLS